MELSADDRRANDAAPPPRSIDSELIALIAANAQRSQTLTLLGALMPTAVLMTHLPPQWPALWLLLLAIAVRIRTRVVLALHADAQRPDARKLKALSVVYTGMACVQSLLLIFFPFVSMGVGAMLTMYLVGMNSGMVPSAAGSRRLVLPYTLIVMSMIALAWMVGSATDFDVQDRVLFAVMSLMYGKVLLDYADTAYRVFVESYAIRKERLDLNEKLARALDSAEAASRAKTRFLASASHDLRQPIHALSLFSGSLLLRDLDSRSRDIAGQIDKSVRVLGSQLDALLDISRLDAGVVEKSICIVDLRPLLEQLADDFRAQAERKGLSLRLRCAHAMPVWTDPILLHRVIGNLLSNALKYTEAGSIDLSAERLGDHVRLRVRDTGIGVPEFEHARVFEEFYQLGNPERDRSKGLGLGLAIVRRLTELLGLTLHFESRPGWGTAVSLHLKPASAQDGLGDSRNPPREEQTDLHVLVVDDEEAVRSGMTMLLEELGFSVEAVGSSEEALACAQRRTPQIVLADFRLRGQDSGLRAIESLRKRLPDLPALLISGDTGPERLRDAHDARVTLLHKPVTIEQLRESIQQAVVP